MSKGECASQDNHRKGPCHAKAIGGGKKTTSPASHRKKKKKKRKKTHNPLKPGAWSIVRGMPADKA